MLELLGFSLFLLGNLDGTLCSVICPSYCMLPVENGTETCDYSTEECLHGCQLGYAGPYCSVECPHSCALSNTSGVEICNATSDECLLGCKDGSYGARCEKQCFAFDINCKRCSSKNDISVVCDECGKNFYRDNGKCKACDYWCDISTSSPSLTCRENDGYCNFGCKSGRFGFKCGERCSTNCNDICDRDTGMCSTGCKYQNNCGPMCEISCNDGCANQQCNQDCTCLQGCTTTYWGKKCEHLCNSKCTESSYPNSNICERSDGSCLYGCENDNFWGDRCHLECNKNCLNLSCNRSNGYCNASCEAGWYGNQCEKECNKHCIEIKCERRWGYCSIGCVAGWHGEQCNRLCSGRCLNLTCQGEEDNCTFGYNDLIEKTDCEDGDAATLNSLLIGGLVSGWVLFIAVSAVFAVKAIKRYQNGKVCKDQKTSVDEQHDVSNSGQNEYMSSHIEPAYSNQAAIYEVLNQAEDGTKARSSGLYYENVEQGQL